jgi:hypothetical protein
MPVNADASWSQRGFYRRRPYSIPQASQEIVPLADRNLTLIQKAFDLEELAQKIRESLNRNCSTA